MREQKMNDTVRLLHAHHSDRSYKSDPIPDDILDSIIEAAHRAPTSINTQEVSIIVVKDAGRRIRISELAGGQPWIAKAPVFLLLVADLYKTRIAAEKAGITQEIQHSLEGVIASVTDVGIALGALMVAARSYGLGIVPIGAVRREPQAVIDLFGAAGRHPSDCRRLHRLCRSAWNPETATPHQELPPRGALPR